MNDFDETVVRDSEQAKHASKSNRNCKSASVSLSLTPELAQSFALSVADFRRSGAFCDLEILCEHAKSVRCHRIVAAAASPVLRSALKSVENEFICEDGIARINLPDFSAETVGAYVSAIYDALSGASSGLEFCDDVAPALQELALFLAKEAPSQSERKDLQTSSTATRCQGCLNTHTTTYPESTANLTIINLKEDISPPPAKVPKLEESGGDDALLLPAKRDRRREQKLKLHRGEKVPVEEMRRMVENCSGSFFPVRTNKNAFEPGKKKDRYCMKNENDFLVLCGVARCSKKKVLLAREAIQQELFFGPVLDECL